MTDLSDLISRVRAATGPDRELDRAIRNQLFPDDALHVVYTGKSGPDANEIVPVEPPPITASLDAAIELCERVLPNARIKFDFDDSYARAEIWQGRGYAREKLLALHEDPNGEAALALILAVLLAKQEIDRVQPT